MVYANGWTQFKTISAAASCLIHSLSAPISGRVQIFGIKRQTWGIGLHYFAFSFFLQKREKHSKFNLFLQYGRFGPALGLEPLTPEQLREVVQVTSEWRRKDVNILHYKSLQEILFRSCDFFSGKKSCVNKDILETFSFIVFKCTSLFFNAILLHVCIYFIKNHPKVLHKYYNIFTVWLYWPRPRQGSTLTIARGK